MPSDRLPHRRAALAATSALLAGCLPLGLGGTVDGRDLSFVDVTYAELRGTDAATATPFHDFSVWLMPLEDSCERFGPFLADLADLRRQLQDGLPPEDYCDAWEAAYEAHTGTEGFHVARFRFHALPRADGETPETTYPFFEETAEGHPEGPSFDADLAWYPAPTFDACATEFAGDDLYAPARQSATGGEATIRAWAEDEEISFRLDPEFDGGEGPLAGAGKATFCPAALDWPIEFGRGL